MRKKNPISNVCLGDCSEMFYEFFSSLRVLPKWTFSRVLAHYLTRSFQVLSSYPAYCSELGKNMHVQMEKYETITNELSENTSEIFSGAQTLCKW